MDKKVQCNSCRKEIINERGVARFNCPKCGKYEIIRCSRCREIAAKYNCPDEKCGFQGPN